MGAGGRREPHDVQAGAASLRAGVDQVDPDVAGERFGRALGGVRLREDFHDLSLAVRECAAGARPGHSSVIFLSWVIAVIALGQPA